MISSHNATKSQAALESEHCVARFRHVTKSYGNTQALRGIDLELRTGEIVVVLGRNGAGKTSTVRILVGLTNPTAGTVTVFGETPGNIRARARLGVKLQASQMPDTLRVREHIKLFSSYYAAPRPFAEVVESAGLRGLEGRLFKQLSGGEQQRLLFALAICGNPDLVILDEPTVGLDVEARRAVWDQIRRVASEKKTVLLTTHYLAEADALADRIVVIDAGRVVAEGTPKEIKASTGGKRIRCTSSLALDVMRSLPRVIQARKTGDVTEIQTDDADLTIRQLLERDAELANVEIVDVPLEDSFLAITQHNDSQ